MSFTSTGRLLVPETPVPSTDGWHNRGHGAPCFVVAGGSSLQLYYGGYGIRPLPSNVALDIMATASGVPKASIQAFYNAPQNHIGMSLLSESQLTGDRELAGQLLISPSYPFEGHATRGVYDPSVIGDRSGGVTYDKTVRPIPGDDALVDNFTFWVSCVIGNGNRAGDVIASSGISWRLYFSTPNTVSYEWRDILGAKHVLGPLTILGYKDDLEENQARVRTDLYGRPVIICCGPGVLAVSCHNDDLPDVSEYADQMQYSFIFDEINQYTDDTARQMLALDMEPLTLGCDWRGNDQSRLRSGAILSARVDWARDPLGSTLPTVPPTPAGLRRGISLMQSSIAGGLYLEALRHTTWLVSCGNANGALEVLDTASAVMGQPLTPYPLMLRGGYVLRDLVLVDAPIQEKWEIETTTTVNSLGNVYIDVKVGNATPFWVGTIEQAPSGVISSDAEDNAGQDASVEMVISRRDGTLSEAISVYAWEDMGPIIQGTGYGYLKTIHRLYLSDAPAGDYPTNPDSNVTPNVSPFVAEYSATGMRHYKAIVNLHDPAREVDPNYYSMAQATKPDMVHQQKMVYVGYDGTYYSVLWCPLGYAGAPLGNQRAVPIWRSTTRLSAPTLYRYRDDYYVTFTEGDPLDDSVVRVLYRKSSDLVWTQVDSPLLSPLGAGWEADAVQMGGLHYNPDSNQIILSYAGYEDADAELSIGVVSVANLISPVLDSRRPTDPSGGLSVNPVTTNGFRAVSGLFKTGNDYRLAHTGTDTDTLYQYIDVGSYEFESGEVIPGESLDDYDEFYEPDTIPNQIRALHRYYKRNGIKSSLAISGTNIYRGADALDPEGRITIRWAGVGRQTDVPATHLTPDDNLIYLTTFDDWVFIAHKGDPLTRWAGGLVHLVGITAPATAPTLQLLPLGLGSLANGTYTYAYTYYTSLGESNPSPASVGLIVAPPNRTITVTWDAPPAGQPDVVGVKVYRKEATETTYQHVATIASRTTVTYVDDGTTAATATGAAPPADHDTPLNYTGIAAYQDILVGWRDNAIHWSKPLRAEYWPEDNTLYLDTNGEDITAVATLGNQLVVYTYTSIHSISPVGSDTATGNIILSARRTRAAMGTPAPRSVAVVPSIQGVSGLGYLGTDRSIWIFNGEDSLKVSDRIDPLVRRISKVYMYQAAGVVYDNHYFLCAPFNANVNNAILDLDLARGGWTYHTNQHIATFATYSSQRDGYILLGGDSRRGYVYQVFDPSAISDDGDPIRVMMRTKTFDLGKPEVEKQLRKLFYDFTGAYGLVDVTVYVDGGYEDKQSIPVPGWSFTIDYSQAGSTLTAAGQYSDAFAPLVPGVYTNRGGFGVAPRNYIGDTYQGYQIIDVGSVEIDEDRYIVFPAILRGRKFWIELATSSAPVDFQIDSLGVMLREGRSR